MIGIEYEVYLRQTLIVGFGVPPYAHEDDPARSVRCALALESSLHGLRLEASFGETKAEEEGGAAG